MGFKLLIFLGFIVTCRTFLLKSASCANRCFTKPDYIQPCQCHTDCESHRDCCHDFWNLCRGSETGLVVTPHELNTFAQTLWDSDDNRIASNLYTLEYQGHTNKSSRVDVAPTVFIQPISDQLTTALANTNTTYPTFIKLLDNYALLVHNSEHRHNDEIIEENKFWKIASKTRVMNATFDFLVAQGFIKGDHDAFRTVFNEFWFTPYATHINGHVKNSGFEHIMVGEKNNDNHHGSTAYHINGFSNWVQFYLQEQAGHLDYLGYLTQSTVLPIAHVDFLWHNALARDKFFFVGTSPEFDMALYTVCALVHKNGACHVTINGQHIVIKTAINQHYGIIKLKSAIPFFHSQHTTMAPSTNP